MVVTREMNFPPLTPLCGRGESFPSSRGKLDVGRKRCISTSVLMHDAKTWWIAKWLHVLATTRRAGPWEFGPGPPPPSGGVEGRVAIFFRKELFSRNSCR